MLIRELRDDELYKSAKLSSLAFSYAVNIEEKKKEGLKEHTYGAFLDDGETLIAQVVAICYASYHNGVSVGALGIAGVASSPEHRRAGAVRAIFNHLFSIAGEKGWELSYLYPFSFRYYRKFGYERAVRHRTLTVALPALNGIPRNCGATLMEGDASLPELLTLYNRFAQRYNACFARKDDKYFPLDPYGTQTYFYLWRNASGEARGYFKAKPNGRTLDVPELVYLDRESLLACSASCGCLKGSSTASASIGWNRARRSSWSSTATAAPPSALMTVRWAACSTSRPACAGMRAESGETLTLRITDEACPKNTGIYLLRFTDGETTVEKRCDGDVDASLTINAFSLLALAGASDAELDYVDGLTIYGKRALLAKLFARRPVNLFEEF